MKVADYKELRVYRLAFDSAMAIFEASKNWPQTERYSLTDQIRRSSRSVCANIAEAWRKRRYTAAFVNKLSDSDAEGAETEVHLEFALRCGYLTPEKHAELRDHYDHICRQLTRMMDDAPSWCGGDALREVPPEYVVEPEGTAAKGESEERQERSERTAYSSDYSSHSKRSDGPRSRRSDAQ